MSDPEADLENVIAKDLNDTVTVKYQLKYQLGQGDLARFVIYGAVRRYQEKDRLVILYRSFTEGLGEFEGLQADETMWAVVRPSSEENGVNKTSSVLESYARFVPMGFGSTPGSDKKIDKFVKILAESGEQESRQMMVMMERLVLKDS